MIMKIMMVFNGKFLTAISREIWTDGEPQQEEEDLWDDARLQVSVGQLYLTCSHSVMPPQISNISSLFINPVSEWP